METIEKWVEAFNILTSRVGLRFANSKTRGCFRAYMQGLLQPVKRKNSWPKPWNMPVPIASNNFSIAPSGPQMKCGMIYDNT